jgi:hypothetical protein
VVVVDHEPKQVQQPGNLVPVSAWEGTNRADSALLDLIPFLECTPGSWPSACVLDRSPDLCGG